MSANRRWRWPAWGVLLCTAGWLAVFGDKTPADAASLPGSGKRTATAPGLASPAKATPRRSSPPRGAVVLEALRPRDDLGQAPMSRRSTKDLFATIAPASTPAPPAVTPEPPPPPPAFTFLGKKLEGDRWEVYLTRDDKSYIVREGMTIDDNFRVDKIEPPTLTMTQIPTSQALTIFIGNAL